MEAAPTMRNNFANLRIKVIEPAVKESCEKDGLAVTWEAEKAGRKVKALVFKFPVEQQAALILEEKPLATMKPKATKTTTQRVKKEEAVESHGVMTKAVGQQHLQRLLQVLGKD